MENELKELGASSDFRCPIGLKIKSNEPSEIAISIIAELLEVRDSVNISTH
jgi:xanthine/CO dehydrogenase XdhC/CoxF family maturation factor